MECEVIEKEITLPAIDSFVEYSNKEQSPVP